MATQGLWSRFPSSQCRNHIGRKRTPEPARRSPSRLWQPNASHHHQGKRQQAGNLAGTGEPYRLVLEHAPSTAENTCGSKAPGDKESKGPLSGDQAQLPLQKPRHSWVVGHAAGCWEQPLSPIWGSSRGAGACLQSSWVDFGCQGPELVAVCSLGQMKRAGQAEPCRDMVRCLQSQGCRKGRQAGMGGAGQAVVTAGRCRTSSPWVASGCMELA